MKTNSRAIRAAALIASGLFATSWSAVAQTPPPLGTARQFTILGGSAVTNTGETIINGDVGVSPGSSITGFPPGTVIGTIYVDVAPATTAHADTITAYNYLQTNEPTPISLTGQNLGGMTLAPGVYSFSSSAQLTGTLTLNNVLDPTGTYVFQIASTLTTASSSAVVLLGGSDPNIFWQVGTSATLGTGTVFDGDILADTSITLDPGASLSVGSALAINGAVTMAGGNMVNLGALATPAPSNPSSGIYWNGDTSTSWGALNWSSTATDNTGVGSAELLTPNANVVFSVTGTTGPQNENTVLNAPETIASLTVNDPVVTGVSISGDTLTISGALGATSTLTINPGAAQTTITSNLVLGGMSQGITVNNVAGLVIDGVVSGTIGLTKEGVGTLYLTNANIYSGGTAFGLAGDLVAGTVEIGDGVVDDGSTEVSPTTITPFGSTTVTVNAPTVLTTDGGATGNSYTLANNFVLAPPLTVDVPTLTSLTMSGNITGVDGLTVNAGAATRGTLILTGDATGNTYSGATLLQGGTLQAGTLSGSGNAFSPDSDFALSGGGTLDINGNSETIASLAGTVGTTVTNSGNGSAALTVNDANSSIVGTPVTYEFDGTLTDAGTPNTLALVKQGPGTLILTGANSYNGGTTISAGTLVVGSPTSGSHSSTALGNGNVINSATLETTATLAGNTGSTTEAINVRGTYTQNAGGNLLLQVASSPLPTPSMNTGTAGVNYDTLLVTGVASLGGSVDLNFNAASVPSQGQRYVVVQSVAGPVMGQFSNNPTDTTGLPASFFTVTTYNDNFGNPALNNSAIVTLLQPFTSFQGLTPNQNSVATNIDSNLTILNNNGSLATPTGVNADFFNNIVTGLSLASSSGSLGAALDQLSPQRFEILHNVAFDDYALDVQNLDDELARERTGTGGLDTSGFVFNDSTLGPELSQIKGRLLAWNPAPETGGLLSDSISPVLGGVEMSDAKDMKEITHEESVNAWNTFIDGGVDLGDLDHNSDVSHASYTTGRVRAGADYRISTNIRVGALIGYSHTDAELDNEGSMAHVDSYTPGIYAAYADNKGFYANGLFTYSRNDYSTNRDIIIPGVNRTATGSPSGNQFGGDLDGGYEFHKGNWTFGPSAGLTYVDLDIDSFNESGAGAADLSVNNQSSDSLRSRLGGTVRYQARIGSLVLTPHASAFWQHEFLDNAANITSSFVGLPGGTFAVQTTRGDRDNALLGFGIDAELNKNVTLFVDYGAEAGGSTFFGQSATGGVKVGF